MEPTLSEENAASTFRVREEWGCRKVTCKKTDYKEVGERTQTGAGEHEM
jgi:hypothetical protein